MKVLIVAQYFPPDLGGGPTRALNVAKGLKMNGCEVSVVTAFPHYPDGDIPKKYRWRPLSVEYLEGMKVVRTFVPPLPSAGVLKRIFIFFTFMLSSLFAFPFVEKADVVWAANPNILSFFPCFLFSRMMKCSLMLNVDDLWPEELENVGLINQKSFVFRLGEVLASIAYSRADCITPVSPGYVPTIEEKYHNDQSKIAVVRSGVDLKLFKPNRGERGDGKFKVHYSGAFSVAYDFDQVLHAAKLMNESSDHVEFVLQGKGESLDEVKSKARDLRLMNVRIMDVKLDRKDVSGLLNEADALLLPLRQFKKSYTGISSKIYEYQAVSKPIICCAEGQPADYITRTGSGIAVKPGDPRALVQSIQYLQSHPRVAESMGELGRTYVEKNLSIEHVGFQLMQVMAAVA